MNVKVTELCHQDGLPVLLGDTISAWLHYMP